MSAQGIHISIAAEKLFDIGGITISNSIFTSLIVSTLLIVFAVAVRAQLRPQGKPAGLQNFAEFIVEALHNLLYGVTGDLKKTRLFFPLIASFFMFILVNNWFGLLPGVGTIYKYVSEEPTQVESQEQSALLDQLLPEVPTVQASDEVVAVEEPAGVAPESELAPSTPTAETAEHTGLKRVPVFRAATADLNTTLALAIISVVATQIIGVQFLGFSYFKKYLNFSSPIMFFVGVLEFVLELAKIMSFAFRLFGNIFAGEVLLVVIAFLLPVVAPMPFYGLELFVGFIQALVFAMLSLVFFNMATIGHEEH